jgi:hypothetical protein
MNISTTSGHATDLHAYIFDDRMCLGAYDVDIHPMSLCNYSSYTHEYYPIIAYYITVRPITNRDIDNLIVIGKTIAQTFLVNAAMGLHPIQVTGVASTYAVQSNVQNVGDLLQEELFRRVQTLVKSITPLSWKIDEKNYSDD